MSSSGSPAERPGKKNDQIISYYTLRVLIGAAGILLPLFLVVAKFIAEGSLKLEFSISDYYNNSSAGDVLVGILFALAFFLFSYKGYDKLDQRTALTGSISALGVALFPTTSANELVSHLHLVFALLLFSVFIFFSVYLFLKKSPGTATTAQKEKRNTIYLICGIIMIGCIAAITLCFLWLGTAAKKYNLVFWLETVALASFGISWITKSEFLYLRDADNKEQKEKF